MIQDRSLHVSFASWGETLREERRKYGTNREEGRLQSIQGIYIWSYALNGET